MQPPLGGYHSVDGRNLFLGRAGTGSPAVIFLAGGGAFSLDYWAAHRMVAEFTTSVLYDRAGSGWSDHVPLPRPLAEVAGELAALLKTADVPPPYVLVGHSLGADYARRYAATAPDEIAGMVFVEPHHEDLIAVLPKELAEIYDAWEPGEMLDVELPPELADFYRSLFAEEMKSWPEAIREPLIERHVSREGIATGLREASNVRALCDELRSLGRLPDVPVVVLTAMDIDPFKAAVSGGIPEALLRQELEAKKGLYDTFAASVPRGENRLVEGVGHVTLSFRRPDTIAQAVRDVLSW